MATLIDVEQLRANFPFVIHEDVPDLRLNFSITSASKRLKSWISADIYDEVLEEDEEEERRIILMNAEGHLALHYALIGLNTQLRNFGLVKSEQVEGNTTNSYFNPSDIANFTTQYLEMAREIAEPYLLADGTPTAGFIGVDGE